MKQLKVKRLRPSAILPERATAGSAGYDLHADLEQPVVLHPHEIVKIPSGIAIALENSNYVGLVYARSGLSANHAVAPVNAVGVIDSDYRGEILIPLINHGEKPYTVAPGDRIAQLVIAPVGTPTCVEVEELEKTVRGSGAFGSTGGLSPLTGRDTE